MSSKNRCFRVHYRDFAGKTCVKYWRDGSLEAARRRALNQTNCREVVEVIEISQAQHEAGTKGQTREPQFLRSNKRLITRKRA